MADNIDNSNNFGSFSIDNTTEMGTGNPELLNDFFSSDSSTANPNEIKEIVKEISDDKIEKDEKLRGKEIVPKKDGESPKDQDFISNFLGDHTDEDSLENKEKEEEIIDDIKKDEEELPQASQFLALGKDLEKLGVFTKDEDEDEISTPTAEEFLERFKAEKKKGAIDIVNEFIGRFGQDYQNAFEAIFVKGADPKEYFTTYNTITNFAELDLSVEDNQVNVMRQSLTDQGLEPEDVTTEIDRLKNYGDLESVAAKHHKVLIKKEALKLQQMEQSAEHELQQKATIKNQFVQNVQTTIQEKLKLKEYDGIPLNSKLANELQDFLLIDGWVTPSGEKLTGFDKAILELRRPENHAQKVKVALLLKTLEKDPTLSTIQRSGITKKSDQIFEELVKQKDKPSSLNSKQSQPRIWFK